MNTQLKMRLESALQAYQEEKRLGFPVQIGNFGSEVVIDTKWSRDTNRSSNGGEYFYWEVYTYTPEGIQVIEKCSCDFWQPQTEPDTYESEWSEVLQMVEEVTE